MKHLQKGLQHVSDAEERLFAMKTDHSKPGLGNGAGSRASHWSLFLLFGGAEDLLQFSRGNMWHLADKLLSISWCGEFEVFSILES